MTLTDRARLAVIWYLSVASFSWLTPYAWWQDALLVACVVVLGALAAMGEAR